MTVQLIGSRIDYEYGYGGYTGKTTNIREVVATFDCKEDAELYIDFSRLKNPARSDRPFRQKSLLCNFHFAEIEEPDDPVPHNPEITSFGSL